MSDDDAVKVRGSWPLAIARDGRVLWHIAGTNPPQYEVDEKLEALWRDGQARLYAPKNGTVIQLSFLEMAA